MNDRDEERALLMAIVWNPDRDALRLAYADWLWNRGRPEWYVVASYLPDYWVKTVPTDDRRYLSAKALPWLPQSVPTEGLYSESFLRRIVEANFGPTPTIATAADKV
jgi:uncharacterized protein (TIGR02996 family)